MSANLARMLALAATVAAFLARAALCQAQTPPSAAEAEAFVAKAEADLAAVDEYESRAAWVQETYINDDTNWLLSKATAEATDLRVRYAKEAARFDQTTVDDVTRRKLYLLKQALVLPAPTRVSRSTNGRPRSSAKVR